MYLPVPPKAEQIKIAKFIESKYGNIEKSIELKKATAWKTGRIQKITHFWICNREKRGVIICVYENKTHYSCNDYEIIVICEIKKELYFQ